MWECRTALLSMLRMCGKGSIKRALVSGDACPQTVMKAIEEILQTRLWPHYGSREMGLGGAICCTAHDGHAYAGKPLYYRDYR